MWWRIIGIGIIISDDDIIVVAWYYVAWRVAWLAYDNLYWY